MILFPDITASNILSYIHGAESVKCHLIHIFPLLRKRTLIYCNNNEPSFKTIILNLTASPSSGQRDVNKSILCDFFM